MNPSSYAYELRVRGGASEVTRAAFDDMEVSVTAGQTVLRTGVIDSAALYGLIGRIESLGLLLLDVETIDGASDGPAPACEISVQDVTAQHPPRSAAGPQPTARSHRPSKTNRRSSADDRDH